MFDMRNASLTALACFSAVAAGCSTHPLPEDFSRRNTKDLVQFLRCELAAGVAKLPNAEQADLENTAVGVDLKLNMTETNNASGGKISLAEPISGGRIQLDFDGAAEKTRVNERDLRIIDTFDVLKKINKDEKCKREHQRANFIYPIAGRIGVDEIVTTYWDVKGLTTYDPDSSADGAAFSDKLTFTTKISAGVFPNITINQGAAELRLTNIALDVDVSRQDIHEITITLSSAEPKKDEKKPNRAASDQGARQTMQVRSFRADPPPGDSFSDPQPQGTNSAVDNVVRKLNILKDADRDKDVFRRLLPNEP